jgi:hypothetical protein
MGVSSSTESTPVPPETGPAVRTSAASKAPPVTAGIGGAGPKPPSLDNDINSIFPRPIDGPTQPAPSLSSLAADVRIALSSPNSPMNIALSAPNVSPGVKMHLQNAIEKFRDVEGRATLVENATKEIDDALKKSERNNGDKSQDWYSDKIKDERQKVMALLQLAGEGHDELDAAKKLAKTDADRKAVQVVQDEVLPIERRASEAAKAFTAVQLRYNAALTKGLISRGEKNDAKRIEEQTAREHQLNENLLAESEKLHARLVEAESELEDQRRAEDITARREDNRAAGKCTEKQHRNADVAVAEKAQCQEIEARFLAELD